MLSLNVMLAFFGASVLLAAAPGPDVLFVLTLSLSSGKKAGVWAAIGNVSGIIFHISAVALGLGALIVNSPAIFSGIKYLGAIYLLYLAYKAFFSSNAQVVSTHSSGLIVPHKFFLQGAMTSLLNPQVTVLLIAFLPQFVDAKVGHVTIQIITLGLLFMAAALIVFTTVAVSSGLVRDRIVSSPTMLLNINRATSLVFVGLAIRLFVA